MSKAVHFVVDKEEKGFKDRLIYSSIRRSFRMIVGHKKDGHGLIALNLIGSKLRKREESSGTVVNGGVQHGCAAGAVQHNCSGNGVQHGCADGAVQNGCSAVQQTELTVITGCQTDPPPFLWVYSTSKHSLNEQVHHSQDFLVRSDSCEDGECKNGIRKNLRGKWNRLLKKKPHHEIYTIPAELRPQLKQIYVY